MIAIPISAIIGFVLGYWYKVYRDDRTDETYKEIIEDIKAAKRMGYEYKYGRWSQRGVD